MAARRCFVCRDDDLPPRRSVDFGFDDRFDRRWRFLDGNKIRRRVLLFCFFLEHSFAAAQMLKLHRHQDSERKPIMIIYTGERRKFRYRHRRRFWSVFVSFSCVSHALRSVSANRRRVWIISMSGQTPNRRVSAAQRTNNYPNCPLERTEHTTITSTLYNIRALLNGTLIESARMRMRLPSIRMANGYCLFGGPLG